MLTKDQKKEHVAASAKLIAGSKSLVFADFSGAPTKDIEKLKADLKKVGATYKVFKKRLLKIALKEAGVAVDSLDAKAPVVAMFAQGDMTSVAAPVFKFSKDLAKRKINFKVLGAYDREANKPMTVAEFNIIARLPSREVLLAQLMSVMQGSTRKFLATLSEIAKKKEAPAAPVAEAAAPVAAAAV